MKVWQVLFRGQVQGVGFRYSTARLAKQHSICGWVENLPDGSVKMIIQGTQVQRDQFISAVKDQFEGMIREISIVLSESMAIFNDFEIIR